MVLSKSLILSSHPTALPVPGKDLTIQSSEFDLTSPPPPGGLLLRTNYISYDPYQRGRMRPNTNSYTAGYTLNAPLDNNAISTVLKSDNPRFQEGDIVIGPAKYSEYQYVTKERADIEAKSSGAGGFSKLNNPLGLDPAIFLGALGMSGLTAYSSFYEIGKPKKGEVIFISAASGAVGQVVGQLAKREGLKVIGSVGSDEKLKFIKEELGFDAGFNYKKESAVEGLQRCLKEIGANGVSIYYDNVGGEQLDAAILFMDVFGRIIKCGSISQTSRATGEEYGVKNLGLVVARRIVMRGFLVFDPDFEPKYTEEHQKNMQKWIKDGEIVVKMDVTRGMDRAAEGLVGMLKGENFGKAVLEVAPLEK